MLARSEGRGWRLQGAQPSRVAEPTPVMHVHRTALAQSRRPHEGTRYINIFPASSSALGVWADSTSPRRWPRCDARRGYSPAFSSRLFPSHDLHPKLLVSERRRIERSIAHMLALTICPLRLPQGRQSHRSVVRLSHEGRAPLRDVAQRAAVLSLPRRALCAAAGLALAAGPASQATASQAVGSAAKHGQSVLASQQPMRPTLTTEARPAR